VAEGITTPSFGPILHRTPAAQTPTKQAPPQTPKPHKQTPGSATNGSPALAKKLDHGLAQKASTTTTPSNQPKNSAGLPNCQKGPMSVTPASPRLETRQWACAGPRGAALYSG
jgi:hypothetical protein